MAWKKLAFTDEMLTNPLTGNLDMDGNAIIKIRNIYATDSTSDINIVAHNILSRCPRLSLYGTTYTNAGDRGTFQFFTPGAGGTSQILAMAVGGLTDSPPVYVYFGLDMNQKDIENVAAIRPYDSVGVGVMMEDANGVDQVEFGIGNGSYAMVAYRPIDMNQKAFDGMVFGNLATAPHAASEVQGEAYYNTADDHIHVWVV